MELNDQLSTVTNLLCAQYSHAYSFIVLGAVFFLPFLNDCSESGTRLILNQYGLNLIDLRFCSTLYFLFMKTAASHVFFELLRLKTTCSRI